MHRSIHILFNISEFFPFPFPLALIYTKMASEDITGGKISSVICCQTRESPLSSLQVIYISETEEVVPKCLRVYRCEFH